MDVLFIKSDAEYQRTRQRLASLKGLDSEQARNEVALLSELVRAYESRPPQHERGKLAEAIQRLTREGELDGLSDEETG